MINFSPCVFCKYSELSLGIFFLQSKQMQSSSYKLAWMKYLRLVIVLK